jgi:hypothetical protein
LHYALTHRQACLRNKRSRGVGALDKIVHSHAMAIGKHVHVAWLNGLQFCQAGIPVGLRNDSRT